MEYGADKKSYVDSMSYHVIALPSVVVDPMVVGVYIRDPLTIECRLTNAGLTSDHDEAVRFIWSKDGRNLTSENKGSYSHVPQHLGLRK